MIQALAGGKEAAESIRRFLEGEDLREGRETQRQVADPDVRGSCSCSAESRKKEVPAEQSERGISRRPLSDLTRTRSRPKPNDALAAECAPSAWNVFVCASPKLFAMTNCPKKSLWMLVRSY